MFLTRLLFNYADFIKEWEMLLLNLQDLMKNENVNYKKMLNNTSHLLFRQRGATKPNLQKI